MKKSYKVAKVGERKSIPEVLIVAYSCFVSGKHVSLVNLNDKIF